MGQRHQVYLRLPEVNYGPTNPNNTPAVTLGFHNQWMYGVYALNKLNQFLSFAVKNAYGDRRKYRKYADLLDCDRSKPIAVTEALYSLNLIAGSWSKTYCISDEITAPHQYRHVYQSYDTPTEGDNNDGVTVIDLTDTTQPKYCLLNIGHLEGKNYNLERAPLHKPLTALEYAWNYDDAEDMNDPDYQSILNSLSKFPVLSEQELLTIFPSYTELKARAAS